MTFFPLCFEVLAMGMSHGDEVLGYDGRPEPGVIGQTAPRYG